MIPKLTFDDCGWCIDASMGVNMSMIAYVSIGAKLYDEVDYVVWLRLRWLECQLENLHLDVELTTLFHKASSVWLINLEPLN